MRPQVTPELVAEHGLNEEEYARILEALGRAPNFTELGIYSVMWSEHCSYKSSKVHLKTLPTEAPWVICGPGENAGFPIMLDPAGNHGSATPDGELATARAASAAGTVMVLSA